MAQSKLGPPQGLLLPKMTATTGFGQESKTQKTFLLFQEMIPNDFQPFLQVLETHVTGPDLRILQISLLPPLILHLGLA